MRNFIVFDLDGTLLDTLPDIAAAMNRVLFRFGLPQHSKDSYKQFTGNGARMLTLRALAGQEEMAEAVLAAYTQEYAQNNKVKTAPYPGIPELLMALNARGIKLIVYSNKDDADAKDVVAHYFPDVSFALVRGALPDVALKPDPAALLQALEELELAPEDGLYLGDTMVDMQTAKAAGIDAVGVLWGFQSREDLSSQHPEALIEQPMDLLQVQKEGFFQP